MTPRQQRWYPRVGVAAVCAVPLLFLFIDCLRPGTIYFNHDITLQQSPFTEFARASFARGEIPFWNPNLFAGTPLLAPGNAGVLTPMFLLTSPLPLGPAFTVQALLALALAFAGAAWLTWRRTRDLPAAALAGAVYGFSAPVLLRVPAGHPHLLQALAVVPWLLAAGDSGHRTALSNAIFD